MKGEIALDEYRPNSHKSKMEKKESNEEKVITRISKGEASVKKKSGFTKFKDAMISEDAASVKSYIFLEVLVPSAKKAIQEIVDTILYGSDSGSRKKTTSRISYGSFYDERDSRPRRSSGKRGFDYDDIIFKSKAAAEEALDSMDEIINHYGSVSVQDYYEIACIDPDEIPYTADRYGWTDLRNARAVSVRNGAIIQLPKAFPLD